MPRNQLNFILFCRFYGYTTVLLFFPSASLYFYALFTTYLPTTYTTFFFNTYPTYYLPLLRFIFCVVIVICLLCQTIKSPLNHMLSSPCISCTADLGDGVRRTDPKQQKRSASLSASLLLSPILLFLSKCRSSAALLSVFFVNIWPI